MRNNLFFIVIVYLAGIFMGAIDTGIVTPARTIIQNQLQVNEQTGIWMITIYTLAYAASIPIMGKLADRYGRKYTYLISILLFGLGSLFCGLAQSFESFNMLLIARAVQAIGGGGIVPIATAEFGTSFPPEKRGVALGLIGGVYGIANIFGASAGSAILDIFGVEKWSYIFYINVPITIFILIAGFIVLENKPSESHKKLDLLGITTLTTMILSLLYGLKNLDFFDILGTLSKMDVYPYLVLFLVLVPAFIWIEHKAHDPVMNLKYFTNRNIVITMLLSLATGVSLMGVIFVPQFSENALRIPTGSGGYLVMILGLFAGIGAPISGKLIDRFGVKRVLGLGFLTSIVGALFMIFVTVPLPNLWTVIIGLGFVGTGMGFSMGTPINYMMLANTRAEESNSALAALSLVRSIGTAVAPAIMIGFIAHAGLTVQDDILRLMPQEIHVPRLPHAREIDLALERLKKDEAMAKQLKGLDFPKLSALETIAIGPASKNLSSGATAPIVDDTMIALLKSSDVTTIVDHTKSFSQVMFDKMTPQIVEGIVGGIEAGESGIQEGIEAVRGAEKGLAEGLDGLEEGIVGMAAGVKGQREVLQRLVQLEKQLTKRGIEPELPYNSLADAIPPPVKAKMPKEAVLLLGQLKSIEDLKTQIVTLNTNIETLKEKIKNAKASQREMQAADKKLRATEASLVDLNEKLGTLKKAVPNAMETARITYLSDIEAKREVLETTFQDTLNEGFKNVYWMTLVASILAMFLLIFYKDPGIVNQNHS